MTPQTCVASERKAIVVVGGKGGLFARYRETIERHGYQFTGYENRMPAKSGPAANKIALVIVMVTMVSHPLLTQARALVGEQGRIVYLKSPSVSAVRHTVEAALKGFPPEERLS